MFLNANPKTKILHQVGKVTSLKLIYHLAVVISSLVTLQAVSSTANSQNFKNSETSTEDVARNSSSVLPTTVQGVVQQNQVSFQDTSNPNITTIDLPDAIKEEASSQVADFSTSSLQHEIDNKQEGPITVEIQSALPDVEPLISDSDQQAEKHGEFGLVQQDNLDGHIDGESSRMNADANHDPQRFINHDTRETNNKGTMVLVKSKSGKFSEIMPLDDLIVTPAANLDHSPESCGPEKSQNADEPIQGSPDNMTQNPSLAELIAAGTAMGLQMSDLARASSDVVQEESNQNGNDHDESRNVDETAKEPLLETTTVEHEIPERVPESIENLMRSSEQDDLVEPTDDQQDSSASNVVNDEDDRPRRRPIGRGTQRRAQQSRRPQAQPESEDEDDMTDSNRRSFSGARESDISFDERRPVLSPRQDSGTDLKTAAGHYYGKKKKKIKKKKVVKVKKKKVKKYKVKKYKKVKIVKKKKKKMVKKYHHHGYGYGHGHGHGHGHNHGHGHGHDYGHEHGHDHGKYYMYAKVPKKKSWEFGFKRGNKKHWIERHEKGHKNKFKTKVKWYDKKSKGKGIHIWDYNHFDKKKYHG